MAHCKLENCAFATDGRCIEGRGADCPNLVPSDDLIVADDVDSPTGALSESADPFEPLRGRAPLELADARLLARRGRCTVAVLVGMPASGKTSLIARWHQLFQAGTVLDYQFAGSHTLPRFEELNWLACLESGTTRPLMGRSSSQFDNCFTHLTVRSSAHGGQTEVLLNDICGETFENIIGSMTFCEGLTALHRADHVVLLVDGAALANRETRHLHVEYASDFMQRVLQSKQCGRHTAVHVVTSKNDRLTGLEPVAAAMEEKLAAFETAFGSLTFWRLAARPTDGSMPTNSSIAELFAALVETSHRHVSSVVAAPLRSDWQRDFCRYGN